MVAFALTFFVRRFTSKCLLMPNSCKTAQPAVADNGNVKLAFDDAAFAFFAWRPMLFSRWPTVVDLGFSCIMCLSAGRRR